MTPNQAQETPPENAATLAIPEFICAAEDAFADCRTTFEQSRYGNSTWLGNIPDLNIEPSGIHVELLELPWVDVFTTNYDTLLERASAKVVTRRYEPVVNKDDIPYAIKPRIVKLHGSFPSERPFIITEEDYLIQTRLLDRPNERSANAFRFGERADKVLGGKLGLAAKKRSKKNADHLYPAHAPLPDPLPLHVCERLRA